MTAPQMKQLAELIRAVAQLLWPIIVIGIVWRFHREFGSILHRLRHAKVFGQDLDLEEPLRKLESDANAAAAAVPQLPQEPELEPGAGRLAHREHDVEAEVLEQAAQSPKAALMSLSAALERELREILASGWGTERGAHSFRAGIDSLQELGVLPRSLAGAVDHFWQLRNKIVHGHDVGSDDALRAVDSGLTIFRTLRAIPRETNTVYHPGVDLYADPAGQRLRDNVKGLVLQTTSPGGAQKSLRVFPTTQTHFRKGSRVAWEWNMELVTGETWFRHPDTGKMELAWSSSAEFIGAPMDLA
jgi:hypothetical protein